MRVKANIALALIALVAFSMFAMFPIQQAKADYPDHMSESELMALAKRIMISVYESNGFTPRYVRQLVNNQGLCPWWTKKSYFQNTDGGFPSDNLVLRFEDTDNQYAASNDWMDASFDISY